MGTKDYQDPRGAYWLPPPSDGSKEAEAYYKQLYRLDAEAWRSHPEIAAEHALIDADIDRYMHQWTHSSWEEPQSDGTFKIVHWETWMGPWPVVQALLFAIEDTAYAIRNRKPTQRDWNDLVLQYVRMIAKRPVYQARRQ